MRKKLPRLHSFWDATTGREIVSPQDAEARRYWGIQAVAWSPDGTLIALGSKADALFLLEKSPVNTAIVDAATLRPLVTLDAGKLEAGAELADVQVIVWSPDSTRIATASSETQVWDAATGKQLLHLNAGLFILAWSLDGRSLITDNGPDAQVWDAQSGALLVTYHGHTDLILAVAWSPDSTKVVSGGEDGTVQVWDARSGRHLLTYSGHADSILAVAWSPDGRRIASAGYTGNVSVWDATTGELMFLYKGHRATDAVNTLAWSPDGSRIASGSDDETVQIWQPE
jgi:WD40 repeat protein